MPQYYLNPTKIGGWTVILVCDIICRDFRICQNPYGNNGHFRRMFMNEKKSLSDMGIYR